MKVRNLERNGRNVPNQFEIVTDNGVYMQSYESVNVRLWNGAVTLSRHWCYSPTTLKYVKQFLNEHGIYVETKGDIQRKIEDGIFRLVGVNSLPLI